jgi:hypothetical protein
MDRSRASCLIARMDYTSTANAIAALALIGSVTIVLLLSPF